MNNLKKNFAFIFCMLAGIVLGGFIAHACEDKAYLSWLAWGKDIGFENLTLDLYIIKFSIGLMIKATVSQIFTVGAALIIYLKAFKNNLK